MVAGLDQPLSLLLVIAGIIVTIGEAIIPGSHFIVLGVALLAAGIVGLTLGAVIPFFGGPFALALLIVLFGGIALYGYREFDIYGGKGTGRTRDSSSLQGQTGIVTESVTPRGGEVKLNEGGFNPYFSAKTVDGTIPEGTEIIVIDPGGGNVLTVESLDVIEDDIDRELAVHRQKTAEENHLEEDGSGTE